MRLEGPIDLRHSLLGGQAFRWREENGAFVGPIGSARVELRELPGGAIDGTGTTRRALERYFRLEPADAARRERLRLDPVLAPAMRALPGLRLLRQDPWETTVAFITSANNNVLRIEKIVNAIAARYGEPLRGEGRREKGGGKGAGADKGHTSSSLPSPDPRPPPSSHLPAYAFPSADVLARATLPALRACGLGYRAPFVRDAAKMVARGDVDLASLRGGERERVREALLALPGVGPKVADCIALFALDVDDAFPIDRWMLRAMNEAFGRAFTVKDAPTFARERWGKDAGLAQQYLFHAMRLRERGVGVGRLNVSPA